MIRSILIFFFLIGTNLCRNHHERRAECELSMKLKQEIASYIPIVQKIIKATTSGAYYNFTYNELATFVDKFGNRIAGSENLENSIDYMLERLKGEGLENVHGETVTVPHWVRGKEWLTMVKPRYQKLAILGLGGSIATPLEGIKAEAIVVDSFHELETVGSKVNGKIVVFNEDFVSYAETVKYRANAASEAARYGAVATLVRSVTPYSIYSPHTGFQTYSDTNCTIPTASITIEDAKLLSRIQKRGEKIILKLKMEAETLPDKESRNTVAEIAGSEKPDKVVMVSGHLDSWDVGQGAMDDGGGAFISWSALAVLKGLELRAKRTLRSVLWTAEEQGLIGAQQYGVAHESEMKDWVFLMESDEGTFTPLGLEYGGPECGICILQEILTLLQSIGTNTLATSNDIGSDIAPWVKGGIPGASLLNENDKYFWFHHSNGDTMAVENPDSLNKATALWASVAFILADMEEEFPRTCN